MDYLFWYALYMQAWYGPLICSTARFEHALLKDIIHNCPLKIMANLACPHVTQCECWQCLHVKSFNSILIYFIALYNHSIVMEQNMLPISLIKQAFPGFHAYWKCFQLNKIHVNFSIKVEFGRKKILSSTQHREKREAYITLQYLPSRLVM